MSTCAYDRESGEYLTPDGKPCLRDEHGDPTRHCTARRTCSQHVGWRELTCARCLGRVRQVIRKIREHAPLLPTAAELAGVNSEAAYLAGPAADPAVFAARRSINRDWIYANISQPTRDWCEDPDCQRRHFKTAPGLDRWHKRGIDLALTELLEDDDEFHPYTVLTRWHLMLAQDYDDDLPTQMSIESSAAYLDRKLNIVAQDANQDFGLLRREVNTCWNHLQIPLAIKPWHERGAPCPTCADAEKFARLVRESGHWCLEDDCERIHFLDDSGDVWRCPINKDHWWNPQGYADLLEDRKAG